MAVWRPQHVPAGSPACWTVARCQAPPVGVLRHGLPRDPWRWLPKTLEPEAWRRADVCWEWQCITASRMINYWQCITGNVFSYVQFMFHWCKFATALLDFTIRCWDSGVNATCVQLADWKSADDLPGLGYLELDQCGYWSVSMTPWWDRSSELIDCGYLLDLISINMSNVCGLGSCVWMCPCLNVVSVCTVADVLWGSVMSCSVHVMMPCNTNPMQCNACAYRDGSYAAR